MIFYATKAWNDLRDVVKRHKKADLTILNNLGDKYLYMETGDVYYEPELRAVQEAHARGAKYILWYAGDVIPPERDWTKEAIKLLDKYPIVSPRQNEPYREYVSMAKAQGYPQLEETDFGFTTVLFSDHAYMAKTSTMNAIDYDSDNQIKDYYPNHGGNSFERRVAQWLANTNQRVAVLRDYTFHHIPKEDKCD